MFLFNIVHFGVLILSVVMIIINDIVVVELFLLNYCIIFCAHSVVFTKSSLVFLLIMY